MLALQPPITWMYFMNRWHFPQRERGLPVAARGEKDTSINSSMPESKRCRTVMACSSPPLWQVAGVTRKAGWEATM